MLQAELTRTLNKLHERNEQMQKYQDQQHETTQLLQKYQDQSRQIKYYKMSHPKRGMAIIFNHSNFKKNLKATDRPGTFKDTEGLEKILTKLKFEVIMCLNFTLKEIKDTLRKAALRDHTESDCIMVIVLSHGRFGKVLAFDTLYDVNTLPKYFTGDNCPTLAGKPKMFYISACGGNEEDHGIEAEIEIDTDQIEMDTYEKYRIPIMADFLITFSSHPGYISHRSTLKGTWFIECLCSELEKNAEKLDILTILTNVARQIAFYYESKKREQTEEQITIPQKRKQVPYITSTLTRTLQFTGTNI
ncbi:caspase-1-like [Temnothorax longispinosus]|uniref:caspase-1-like n=1 Tax=Temnothorax longispinosus TaxID=300112 RepID=UPI003A9A0C44